MMVTAAANMTKAGFQTEIKRKQGLFNRFKKRYNVAMTAGERQFIKTEACRIVSELKQCCKMWKNCNFGPCNWITKNFTTNCFSGSKNSMMKNPTSRRTTGRKTTTGRNSTPWRTTNRSRTTTSARGRTGTYAAPRNYVAW